MNNEQIIQKIKESNLKPISKSVFTLRKVALWFLLFMSTIFGAYTFAFFFLKTLYVDFDNWFYLSDSYNNFLIENIPIIWIALFLFSIISMFYLFKKTNRGYRYSIFLIATISLFISFALGISLSKFFANKGLLIQRFEIEKLMQWTNPNKGRLSGEIILTTDDYILIRDIKDNLWNVDIQYILDDSKQVLGNDQLISIIGRPVSNNNFVACQILPFDMKKGYFRPDPNIYELNIDDKFIENRVNKDICDFVIKQ